MSDPQVTSTPPHASTVSEFADKILHAIDNLCTLDITTTVSGPAGDRSIETHINMVEGDIATKMSEEFVGDGPYASVRDYQLQREQQGHTIVTDNIQALQGLLRLLQEVTGAKNATP